MGDFFNDLKETITGKPFVCAIVAVVGVALGVIFGDKIKGLFDSRR